MNGEVGTKARRSYRPKVEALEALRLLSSATQILPGLSAEFDVRPGQSTVLPDAGESARVWDEALTQADLADLLGSERSSPVIATAPAVAPDPADTVAGFSQLNRYLNRAWSRAGIPTQATDDATQAVFVTLLQNLGRTRFDSLLADIGHLGVREVLSRDTADGPDFFRAIDTVKKRVQRERTFQPLDTIDVSSAPASEDALNLWRGALREAMDHSLTPREASLVHETLMGKTPAEIASDWGVAPKTVSNEKTRVIQKLREALVADLED